MMDIFNTARAALWAVGVTAAGGTILMTGAALAACPAASDLESGIRFIAPDGTLEVHRRLDAERMEIDYIETTGAEISRTIVIHGTYVQWYGSIDAGGQVVAGSTATTGRPMQPAQMPVPTQGMEWVTSQVFTDGNGSFEETMRATVGTPFTWQLGACAYEALPVVMAISSGPTLDLTNGSDYIEYVTYVPALGTGVLIGYEDNSGRSDFIYSQVAVDGGN